MNIHERAVFALLFVLVGIAVFWTWTSTGTAPKVDQLLSEPYWKDLNIGLFDQIDTKVYHHAPKEMIAEPTYTRHRYPDYCGHNFSLLIHRGLSPLIDSAAKNPQWYDNAPQNMGGYSL